ncbi:MAG: DoxX-like family protein [Citrobacter freundii]|nr:MAG: DoxX-like family protein [Citrobacter freundii]
MSKKNKIIYWVATIWLALGMISTGIVQLFQMKDEIEFILKLGYPSYFISILGAAKLLGVVVILIPGFTLLKEWTYSGYFFMMAGAVVSHIVTHSPASELLPALLLLVLTLVSWYFRPANRKIVLVNQKQLS